MIPRGERHDRAILAIAMADDSPDFGGHAPLDVYERHVRIYFESLAEQGVVLVEQPRCKKCRGTGVGVATNPRPPADAPLPICPRCNGTGRARMVDVAEVVEALTRAQGDIIEIVRAGSDSNRGTLATAAWERIEVALRRFASEDTAKEER